MVKSLKTKVIASLLTSVIFALCIISPSKALAFGTDGIESFVRRLYAVCLQREPDAAGFNNWVSNLRSHNVTGASAAYGFFFSDEYLNRNVDDASFVTCLYNALLGRSPDPSGMSAWTGKLAAGQSRNDLFSQFIINDEWTRYCESCDMIPGLRGLEVTDDDITRFFSNSVLIGSSVTDGFNMYFRRYGRGIMGDVRVCARASYSLLNDMTERSAYIPTLNGTPMRARDIIRNSGCEFAFICMGTNDISNGVITRYQNYLDDIRNVNPDTVIFIEACTPSRDDHPSNRDIDALNASMEQYCSTHEGFYFIDTNTPLKDSSGVMASRYSSDGNVHVTYQGYSRWIGVLTDYVRDFIQGRRSSGDYSY